VAAAEKSSGVEETYRYIAKLRIPHTHRVQGIRNTLDMVAQRNPKSK
jgi:hypothetical protein